MMPGCLPIGSEGIQLVKEKNRRSFGRSVGEHCLNHLCRMFNRAIRGQTTPNYLSTDNDPLYRFHQWQANLRVLETTEIKTVPYVPLSHPFVERLIGTLRRECLDRTLFWTATDLEAKLLDFQHYYNEHRTHAGRKGHPPVPGVNADLSRANLRCYRWQKHCRGLYQTPIAA
jgi:transposase InsO family protein